MSVKRHQGIVASRHQAREARRHGGPPRRICDTQARSEAVSLQRGFSLIEVLLSVFILSIGVISITALFPAGILQQRQSVDDVTGPIVAQNALAILRTKIRAEDFGTFEEFNNAQPPLLTIEGDWPWLRPAFILDDAGYSSGTIDIFNATGAATASEPGIASGIPYSTARYELTSPIIIVTQQERYFPMASIETGVIPPKPQYVWDCMFRRFQGKMMVAIFVYRTTIAGGGDVAYRVPENPSNPDVPPLPINIELAQPWDTYGINPGNTTNDDALILGNDPYNSGDQGQSWQEPGQWILDQNNNLHRVLSQYQHDEFGAVTELIRPVPEISAVATNFFLGPVQANGFVYEDVVSNIFYIPREVTLDGVPVRLTPVYVTVREL